MVWMPWVFAMPASRTGRSGEGSKPPQDGHLHHGRARAARKAHPAEAAVMSREPLEGLPHPIGSDSLINALPGGNDMLLYAILVFAVAAIGGLVLASSVLRGKLAPWAISMLHALLGASGL